ncbi:MAG: hypothetical protein ABIP34_07730 [Rhodoferax sp.]|uniref:hypothetical protein n=1 Tax=Rhodoferax sp. TaxID=50421 RepID=UPI003263C030
MEQAGSNFSWFMAYLIASVLLIASVAAGIMVWQHRKHKRDRRRTARKARARVRAWRDGKSTPSQQAELGQKKGH